MSELGPGMIREGERTLRLLEALDVRAELVDRLDVLLVLLAVKNDASTRLEVRRAVLERHRADRDAGVHRVGGKVKVADCAGVRASTLLLEVRDELDRTNFRSPRDGAGGEDGAERVEAGVRGTSGARRGEGQGRSSPSEALAKGARDLAREVHDVAELLDLHQAVDLDSIGPADAVDVVAREVDEHDVLGPVLEGREERGRKNLIL